MYQGGFVNSKYEGLGDYKLTYPDGHFLTYKGEMKTGLFEGFGSTYQSKTKQTFTGMRVKN